MTIDNTIYDRPHDIWWDEDEPLSMLRTMVNPGRFGYFRRVLIDRLRLDPDTLCVLDVGCGGGLLAEEFARLGCTVTGVDPAQRSVSTARGHAAKAGLRIEYQVGVGEALPLDDGSFDVVYCCDVLEHVGDLDQVIAEIARVLKPGGIFLYDTINRTWLSKLLIIKIAQEWPLTRFVPRNLHDWRLFITPKELQGLMARHGLSHREVVGLKPLIRPVSMLRNLLLLKRGRISYAELGRRLRMRESKDLSTSYMGYAEGKRGAVSRS